LGGVRDYYVLVLDSERFKRAINNLDRIRKVETEHISDRDLDTFLEEFNLLDPVEFVLKSFRAILSALLGGRRGARSPKNSGRNLYDC
jgi:hypothetical protein